MKYLFLLICLSVSAALIAQNKVGINTPTPKAMLHLSDLQKANIWQSVDHYYDTTEIAFKNGLLLGAHSHFSWMNSADVFRLKVNSDLVGPNDTTLLRVSPSGSFAFGAINPTGKIHIQGLSTTNYPQLRLTEMENDFARIKMENNAYTGYWDIAARNHSTLTSALMNFYYFNGTSGSDLMTIRGDGNVGIGNANPSYKLDVNGSMRISALAGTGDRNVVVGANGDFKIGAGGTADTDWTENSTSVYNLTKNIGIGTSGPATKLHLNGSSATIRVTNTSGTPPFTTTNSLDMTGSSINTSSTFGFPMAIQNSSASGVSMVTGGGGVGVGTGPSSNYKLSVIGLAHNSNDLLESPGTFSITNNANEFQQMVFDGNEINTVDGTLTINGRAPHNVILASGGGNIGIGTTNLGVGYRMSVDGKIICEELRIQNSTAWPDYVFSDAYELMSLEALEKSIQSNNHLPGIPAAKIVESEGIAVGDMQVKMMEKIEELTLYIIQLHKEIEMLKKEK